MKRVVITGVNGVIGSAIANLLSDEYEIVGTSIEPENKTGIPMEYYQTDISDRESLKILPNNIDTIVHCAAVINYDNMSTLLLEANCKGVQNISYYANCTSCSQVVYFSSIPVVGVPQIVPITEKHPVNPTTVYHLSKLFGEQLLALTLQNINLVIFRIPSPIGRRTPSNKIIPVFVKNALNGKDFLLKGKGMRIQNYIDVRDIARAVKCAIYNGANGVFNIASDKSYSNRELAELCISLFNSSSKIRYEGCDPEEKNQWIISTEKARTILGFHTLYSIEDSLKDIADSILL